MPKMLLSSVPSPSCNMGETKGNMFADCMLVDNAAVMSLEVTDLVLLFLRGEL